MISMIAITARPAYQPKRGCGRVVAVRLWRTTDGRRGCAALTRPFLRLVGSSGFAALILLFRGRRPEVLASKLISPSLPAALRRAEVQRRIPPRANPRVRR